METAASSVTLTGAAWDWVIQKRHKAQTTWRILKDTIVEEEKE